MRSSSRRPQMHMPRVAAGKVHPAARIAQSAHASLQQSPMGASAPDAASQGAVPGDATTLPGSPEPSAFSTMQSTLFGEPT